MVALAQPVFGPFTVKQVYAELGKLDGASNPDDYEAKQWTAGVTYDLSKRTQLFLYGSKSLNNAQQNANFINAPLYTSGMGTSDAALAKGADPQVFTLGMSHSFQVPGDSQSVLVPGHPAPREALGFFACAARAAPTVRSTLAEQAAVQAGPSSSRMMATASPFCCASSTATPPSRRHQVCWSGVYR